jgi:4-methyl-5(b-hydroxyethyl)-thiazole monophosphate biosynthesis
MAALAEGIHVTGKNGITLHANANLSATLTQTFDCLLLPGGPGVKHLRADARVREAVLRHHRAGKWIAAICAAPTILHDAGLLTGKRYTAHFSVANELLQILANERVVTDGNLITSRGAGTALDFGSRVVEALFDGNKAADVRGSICA